MTQRLMKDALNAQAISRIAKALKQVDAHIDTALFTNKALQGIEKLELRQRVNHLIEALYLVLPHDFERAAQHLSAIKEVWDPGDPNDSYRIFAAWPLIDYVGVYGLDRPDCALNLLKHLTSMFSAEFAIRPFLMHQFDITMSELKQWVQDPDEHVRRLVSEGTRPRLPWGKRVQRLIESPEPGLRLISVLRDDASLYVRRSVANHMNDIAKDHPHRVIDVCQSWAAGADENRKWLIQHALRTLVKKGYPEVFKILGYTSQHQIESVTLDVKPAKIEMGAEIQFSVEFNNPGPSAQIVLDYAIHFVRANGKSTRKVFKLRNLKIKSDEHIQITKRHSFKPITTRRYYPGTHQLEITINGKTVAESAFELY